MSFLRRFLLLALPGVMLIAGCGSTNHSAPVLDRTPGGNRASPARAESATAGTTTKHTQVATASSKAASDTGKPAKTKESSAPVDARRIQPYGEGDWRPETYVVRKGDTLYSIALDFGQDYRDLATWNNLADPS
ncbi:MAG: LysM peptidoglycan-binding domain-containing protein, partial [Burkholderiales bacterium]